MPYTQKEIMGFIARSYDPESLLDMLGLDMEDLVSYLKQPIKRHIRAFREEFELDMREFLGVGDDENMGDW